MGGTRNKRKATGRGGRGGDEEVLSGCHWLIAAEHLLIPLLLLPSPIKPFLPPSNMLMARC